jgi:hypothetical protein
MPIKLRNLMINRVDLVDQGANPGAHITLTKRANTEDSITMPPTTANAASMTFLKRATAAHPALSAEDAIARYAADHPEEYRHATGQTMAGTEKPYTAPVAFTAPMMKRSDGTARILATAAVMRKHLPDLSVSGSIELAARMRPDAYAAHSGHAAVVRKAGPATERELERKLVTEYLMTRDALRRDADTKAAIAIGQTMGPLIAALLNLWAAE